MGKSKIRARLAAGAAPLAFMLALVPAAASAQDAAEAPPEQGGFSDIIVTANKRAENVQDVAIPVTALNEELIEQKFSRDLFDLGSIAPNLIIDPILGNGTAAISIRGIQLNDVEKSFDPPVGVFLDGVYLASTTGALLTVYDASSIEVLRGPQGTLFGRNTIGGLIHVQRNKPTGELGGKASVTYGRFDQFDLKAVLNLPAVGNGMIKSKISAVRLDGGGYFYNVTRKTREGNNDLFMISPQVLFDFGGGAELNLTYDYIRDRTPTRPVTALTEANELFGGLFGVVGGGVGLGRPASDAAYHRRPTTSTRQDARLTTHSITANGTLPLGDGHDLVAVVNYRDTDENALQEFDAVAADLFNSERPQQENQFSAELRYQGDYGPVKVVAGGYYFQSNYNINQRIYFFGGEVPGADFQQNAKSYAAFGQLDWEIVKGLILTAGGRYLEDQKKVCGGAGLGPISARTYRVSYGDCSAKRRAAPGFSNVIGGSLATGRATWNKFTPKVGLSYAPNDDILLYGSYSEGFRSGGFNGRGTNIQTLGPYNPESVKNFELGLKTELLDKRLIVNLSAFRAKYANKQEDVVFPDLGGGGVTVSIVQNAAAATIKGIEIEAKAMPIEGLTFGFNFGYLDAKYDRYFDLAPILSGPSAGTLGPIDKSNFLLRRAPKYTGEVSVFYELPVSDSAALQFSTNYNFKSDYSIVANTVNTHAVNPGLIDGFGTLNASISYKTDRFKLSAFGRNLTGEDHFVSALDVGTTFGRSPTSTAPIPNFALWSFGTINPPTTYGVEFEVKF